MTLKLHRMQMPREILIGKDATDHIIEIFKELGFRESAFIVTGTKTYKILGRRVLEILEDSGIDVDYHIAKYTDSHEVESIERRIKGRRFDVILGVGGGSKIDLAKFTSFKLNTPFISIPTSASHDGIASPVASIEMLGKPYSMMTQSPIAVIVDTEVIIKSPYRFTASGCGDAIAKFTAVKDWKLAKFMKGEYYGDYAASLAELGAKHVVENAELIQPNNEEGLRILLEALISCGVAMGIAGSSRPCSGSEHLFCHALKVLKNPPPLHGESCGVGSILMAYIHNLDWSAIKDALRKVGAPTNSEELNVEPEIIVKAMILARDIRPERYTILNERRLTYEEAEEIAVTTGVI